MLFNGLVFCRVKDFRVSGGTVDWASLDVLGREVLLVFEVADFGVFLKEDVFELVIVIGLHLMATVDENLLLLATYQGRIMHGGDQ